MSTKSKARDNDYYLDQLKRLHPAIHSDYLAGKHLSVSDARRAAGTLKDRTRLQELKNAWKKASAAEQEEFKRLIGCGVPGLASAVRGSIAVERRLIPSAAARIIEVRDKRRMTMGDIATDLGLARSHPSIGSALNRGSRLQPAVIQALEGWLEANRSV